MPNALTPVAGFTDSLVGCASAAAFARRQEYAAEETVHVLAALIDADGPGLGDSPARTRCRRTDRQDLARVGHRIPGEHGLDPAQVTKARRRTTDCDFLAARLHLGAGALAFRNDQLHADRRNVPSGRGKAAEQRCAAGLFIEMKRLRIELARERLDRFGGECEGAEFAALT